MTKKTTTTDKEYVFEHDVRENLWVFVWYSESTNTYGWEVCEYADWETGEYEVIGHSEPTVWVEPEDNSDPLADALDKAKAWATLWLKSEERNIISDKEIDESTWSLSPAAKLAYDAGFRGDDITKIVAIVKDESCL